MGPERDAEDPTQTRPYYRLLGMRVESRTPAGSSRLRIDTRPELENSRGDFHGGVIASLLDAAMGVAVRSGCADGEGATTVSLTVNYLEPGRRSLVAIGLVRQADGFLASAEAEVVDASGRVVAHGIATMRILRAAR